MYVTKNNSLLYNLGFTAIFAVILAARMKNMVETKVWSPKRTEVCRTLKTYVVLKMSKCNEERKKPK